MMINLFISLIIASIALPLEASITIHNIGTVKVSSSIKNKKFKVLCLDGGGVRGLIPARILQELEEKSGKPISELFDLIVGTSTGGLVAIALTIPAEKGSRIPKYKAKDIVDIYYNRSKEIFPRSIWRNLITGWGLWGARYDRTGIDKVISDLCGTACLSETLVPIAIVSYSIDRSLPHLWLTRTAQLNPLHNYKLFDVGGATSAAPTYFPPKIIVNSANQKMYEADGGLYANNPETIGMVEALTIAPHLKSSDILIVSIGTGVTKLEISPKNLKDPGVIGWVLNANLIDIMLNANSEWSESEAKAFYPSTIRLQINLPHTYGHLDNCTSDNLKGLLNLTENFLLENKETINLLLKNLIKD